MTDAEKIIIPQHLGTILQTSESASGLIRKSGFESRITFG